MTPATPPWSDERAARANLVASVLYGVIAIMTAELAVDPEKFLQDEAALGAALIGLAMMLTRFFVDLVKKETELHTHLSLRKAGALLRQCLPVLAFPLLVAAILFVAARAGLQWSALIDLVLYLSIGAVFLLGFSSSYVLDGKVSPAALRGMVWTLLSLALFAAKKLA
jgi:hypothetical protein